jgi:prepilin-type N-terminal cleavage/methylation domain-containing protein
MKIKSTQTTQSGFTLIEMIGVLAVIAILAALLIPKIFEAINNARVNNAAVSSQTVKTAIADHYAKFGSIPVNGGAPGNVNPPAPVAVPSVDYDSVLVTEGFLDKPFAVKIGNGLPAPNDIVLSLAPLATVDPTAANSAYNLDNTGTGGTDLNKVIGSVVVEALIVDVTENDAKELNDRVDGLSLGVALGAAPDVLGRVKYGTAASGIAGLMDVRIYLTHR